MQSRIIASVRYAAFGAFVHHLNITGSSIALIPHDCGKVANNGPLLLSLLSFQHLSVEVSAIAATSCLGLALINGTFTRACCRKVLPDNQGDLRA